MQTVVQQVGGTVCQKRVALHLAKPANEVWRMGEYTFFEPFALASIHHNLTSQAHTRPVVMHLI